MSREQYLDHANLTSVLLFDLGSVAAEVFELFVGGFKDRTKGDLGLHLVCYRNTQDIK